MAVASIIGTKPKAAVALVISTGRSRNSEARRIASSVSTPSANSLRMYDTSTSPLSTAMPNKATKPTPAEIENGISRTARATTPPTTAKRHAAGDQ